MRGVVEVEVGDGGDDAGGSVGGSGNDAAAGGVFFVDGHGDQRDGVHGGERIAEAAAFPKSRICCLFIHAFETSGEAGSAATDVEAAGEGAFGGDATVDTVGHGLPKGEDGGVYGGFWGERDGGVIVAEAMDAVDAADDGGVGEEGDLVGHDELGDGEVVVVG